MDSQHEYVIVGAGLAGASAVQGIRERDQSGSVLLLGREEDIPYDRPPLTKQLWFGKKKLEDVYLHERSWYAANRVDLELGRTITRLEPANRAVVDDHGQRHSYRKLLLATGGIPRRLSIPGGDLEGIVYYRTINDYRQIRAHATPGKSAVVIGGGFIGSELAAALSHAELNVTMLFPGPYLGRSVFPEPLGRFVQEQYQARGIRVLHSDVPLAISARNGGFVTRTRSGAEVVSDLVIVGIGIAPATELAESAGLAVADGIVVNGELETSTPGIYAAGDNAWFYCAPLGQSMRVEHWANALGQGQHAGRNLTGSHQPYLELPFFFSDLFEFGYEAVGEVDTRLETFADWQEENRKGVIYYLSGERVRGAMMWNVWDRADAARQLIQNGKTTTANLRGAIR